MIVASDAAIPSGPKKIENWDSSSQKEDIAANMTLGNFHQEGGEFGEAAQTVVEILYIACDKVRHITYQMQICDFAFLGRFWRLKSISIRELNSWRDVPFPHTDYAAGLNGITAADGVPQMIGQPVSHFCIDITPQLPHHFPGFTF